MILIDRPRNVALIEAIEKDLDLLSMKMSPLSGIGGAPEVTTACAVKCLGGHVQERFWAKYEDRTRAEAKGQDLARIPALNDLGSGENVFVALTAITDRIILPGVRDEGEWSTDSLAMPSVSGTVRRVETHHNSRQFLPNE